MSDNKDEKEAPTEEKLKQCGHAPAEKIAGGVRIARKEKRTLSENDNVESKVNDEESEQGGSQKGDELEKIRQSNNILASSGLAGKTKKDYPEEAVRSFHEKPLPTHQKPVDNQPRPRQDGHVFQPQRFN